MLNKTATLICILALPLTSIAQPTFKAGWNTYNTGMIIHECTYQLNQADSMKLSIADSTVVYVSTDSLVTLTVHYSPRERSTRKTARYLNIRKQLMKLEEYKDENLVESNDWKYDEMHRKIYHIIENKITGNSYRKNYDYSSDKKSGDIIITESSYENGKIEFYTRCYIDKNNVKYKEVRLNNNNKDVVHVETFIYGDNGKVKERSVYFTEWKVTRKFPEAAGAVPARCTRIMPMGMLEKPSMNNRIVFMKRVLAKNQSAFADNTCTEYEYKFTNLSNCEMIVTPLKSNKMKQVVFRFKQKV
jgi:hypothetical protein